MNDSPNRRNRVTFGLGTVGRDMFYAFEANTLLYFLTNVLSLPLILSGIKVTTPGQSPSTTGAIFW